MDTNEFFLLFEGQIRRAVVIAVYEDTQMELLRIYKGLEKKDCLEEVLSPISRRKRIPLYGIERSNDLTV